MTSEAVEPFGHGMLVHFNLSKDLVNLNHGSFGATPKQVFQRQMALINEQEAHPDRWFRETYFKYIEASRKKIGEMINGDPKDIVLLENVSSAVNSLLRTFPFQEGDKILIISTAYGMVIDTLTWLEKTLHIKVIVVDLSYPVASSDAIYQAVKHKYEAYPCGDIKMAIFSHISSMPTMIEPVAQLTALAKSYGSIVLIDGAHAPGVLKIDVEAIGAEFYTGNCHKWLFTPKGSAFLWVKDSMQSDIFPEPTVISSSGVYDFTGRFDYTGTRDYTPLAAIPAGLEFRKSIGGDEKIYKYCHDLIITASNALTKLWETKLLVEENLLGVMSNVILPVSDQKTLDYIVTELDKTYGIYIVARGGIKDEAGKEIFYVRLSGQIYLELSDFERMGVLFLQLRDQYRAINGL